MLRKIINFFETYVEKIVLAVVVLVCIPLLFIFVLRSPSRIKYNDEMLSPGEIDIKISNEAESLKRKLNEPPKPPEPYEPCLPRYVDLFESPIKNVDGTLNLPRPSIGPLDTNSAIKYNIPLIGEVNEVAVEHIRAVAYLPTSIVDEKNAYKKENSEPNNIDFVTVEGKFDVAGLYQRFQECFAGEAVKKEGLNDPGLAKPIFAAVHLQRQELNSDGTWSNWENVARTRIDPYKKLFEVIEDVQDLPPGGLTVRTLQFSKPEITINLLQPEAYAIASADEEWYPPTFHSKYLEQQRQKEIEAKRGALEKLKEEREKELDERRSSRTDTRTGTGRSGGGYGSEGGSRSVSRPSTKTTRTDTAVSSTRAKTSDEDKSKEETTRLGGGPAGAQTVPGSKDDLKRTLISDFYNEFYSILITPETDFAKMDKPLLIWAHDDTTEPGKSYRYKIRLGVFNPIAGTNQFSEQDKSRKNDVILWSEFSDITEKVVIPKRSYFFANDIQEAAKTVIVEVCKYALGYWYSEKFPVKQGEVIGKVKPVELKPEEKQSGITVPETIDYSTGAVFVDVMLVNDLSGGPSASPGTGKKLVAKDYYDMLYSFDGVNIEHMPIKTTNWSKELQTTFSEIQKSVKLKKQPLRDWSSMTGNRRQRTPEMGYYGAGEGESLYGERK